MGVTPLLGSRTLGDDVPQGFARRGTPWEPSRLGPPAAQGLERAAATAVSAGQIPRT